MSLPTPYYEDKWVSQYCSDALSILSGLESESIDLLVTDPPYGISFMGKDWDRALPDKNIWAGCLRILKPGAFAFVMSIPRSDCLARMIISLEDAGFNVGFSPMYWTYASGFPKAQNIGKAVDKRLGAEREVVGKRTDGSGKGNLYRYTGVKEDYISDKGCEITKATTPQAKALDGSYGGFQPKPAVEVIIVAMKPLSEKTFVDQALKNQKGITWLDDCRVPNDGELPNMGGRKNAKMGGDQPYGFKVEGRPDTPNASGRFPANLLVSDDVLNDGRVLKTGNIEPYQHKGTSKIYGGGKGFMQDKFEDVHHQGDSGSFSRYFDLDKWAQTLPFLIVPKASKSEKNKGLGEFEGKKQTIGGGGTGKNDPNLARVATAYGSIKARATNNHPTVKPLKLMSYLITLGSREGDTVLDPFMGSGSTLLAAKKLNRHCIGIEIEEKYCEIAAKRCSQDVMELNL